MTGQNLISIKILKGIASVLPISVNALPLSLLYQLLNHFNQCLYATSKIKEIKT
jgi:hypothetical protein